MSSAPRPNVLLITTDQQAALAVGAAGTTDLSTPAMDALGERGVRFERAYCTFPLCTPSRASLYTGRMPHEVGADYNNKPIAAEFRSGEMGNLMAAAGYDCAYGGKWHVPEIEIGEGHGFRKICGFDDWALADRCIDFLRTPRSAPFFLVASFDNPHNICEHSRRQRLPWGPVPHAPVGECPNLPANFEVPAYEPSLIKHERAMKPAAELTEDEWRVYRHTYYRLVEKVDADVARIMAALEEAGQGGDTLVIFTSDHGDGMGAHRWNQKWVLYDESTRIPLIVRPPAGCPARVDEEHLVSNGLDLLPTICDYAGVQPPADLRGRSLRPLIDGEAGAGVAGWRDHVVAETCFGPDVGAAQQARMVRTARYKYCLYGSGRNREQLFDLERDPGEMVNLAVEARYAGELARHRALLKAWIEETGDRACMTGPHQGHQALVPGYENEPPEE